MGPGLRAPAAVVREINRDLAYIVVLRPRSIPRAAPVPARRQEHRNGRAASFRAAHRNLAVVELYQFGNDGESEAAAAAFAPARGVGAIVRFENAEQVFPRDAGPRILHGHFHKIRIHRLDRNENATAAAGVYDRVLDDVHHDLLERGRITPGRFAFADARLYLEMLRVGKSAEFL